MKTRPKKAKEYNCSKNCKEQPREIRDQCGKESIQPLCDTPERLACIYEPVEKCNNVAVPGTNIGVKQPTQDCCKPPRKAQTEVCKFDVHRYCEKFSNISPFPVKKQN